MDLAMLSASLKLLQTALELLKGKFSKKQKDEIIKNAGALIHLATTDDIREFDTDERKQIRNIPAATPAKRRGRSYPAKGSPGKKVAAKKVVTKKTKSKRKHTANKRIR